MELNTINKTGTWSDAADRINNNFSKTSIEVDKLKLSSIRNKGLFPTLDALKSAIPSPVVGDWAVIGDSIPGSIYQCRTKGTWSATGQTGGGGEVDLTDYYTKGEIDPKISEIIELLFKSIDNRYYFLNNGTYHDIPCSLNTGDILYIYLRRTNKIAYNHNIMLYKDGSNTGELIYTLEQGKNYENGLIISHTVLNDADTVVIQELESSGEYIVYLHSDKEIAECKSLVNNLCYFQNIDCHIVNNNITLTQDGNTMNITFNDVNYIGILNSSYDIGININANTSYSLGRGDALVLNLKTKKIEIVSVDSLDSLKFVLASNWGGLTGGYLFSLLNINQLKLENESSLLKEDYLMNDSFSHRGVSGDSYYYINYDFIKGREYLIYIENERTAEVWLRFGNSDIQKIGNGNKLYTKLKCIDYANAIVVKVLKPTKINIYIKELYQFTRQCDKLIIGSINYTSTNCRMGVVYDSNIERINISTNRACIPTFKLVGAEEVYGMRVIGLGDNYDFSFGVSLESSGNVSGSSGWVKSKEDYIMLKEYGKYVYINFRANENHPNGVNADFTDSDLNFIKTSTRIEMYVGLRDNTGLAEEMEIYANNNILANNELISINHQTSNACYATNNTKYSTYLAAKDGIKAIENDVRMTSDKKMILFHNDTIEINGVVKNIEDCSFAELSKFRYEYSGMPICTLEEQVSICKQFNMALVNELKGDFWTDDMVDQVVNYLAIQLGYSNFMLIAAQPILNRLRLRNHKVTLCYISYRNMELPNVKMLSCSHGNSMYGMDYVGYYDSLDKYNYATIAEQCNILNVPINIWSPPSVEAMRIAATSNDNIRAITSNSFVNSVREGSIPGYRYIAFYNFHEDERIKFPEQSKNDEIHLDEGDEFIYTISYERSGITIMGFSIDGNFSINGLDKGEGQEKNDYIHPKGDEFTTGTYLYGLRTGLSRAGKEIKITALENGCDIKCMKIIEYN